MNIDDRKETLELLQHFFFKSFIWSVVLLIIATYACVALHGMQVTVVRKMFNMDEATLNWIIVLSLSLWKLAIVQFNLIPAITIFGIRHCPCCKCFLEKK